MLTTFKQEEGKLNVTMSRYLRAKISQIEAKLSLRKQKQSHMTDFKESNDFKESTIFLAVKYLYVM